MTKCKCKCIGVCGWVAASPVVGDLLYALPHLCWVSVGEVALNLLPVHGFGLLDAFFKLCLAMLYCALSPDLKAVLRSLRRAWTSPVIQGFLLGGILMRVLVWIFSTQVLMQQRTAKAYSFTY